MSEIATDREVAAIVDELRAADHYADQYRIIATALATVRETGWDEREEAWLEVHALQARVTALENAVRDAIACAESDVVPKKKILTDWKALIP
jgi:hypothetical protein